MGEAWGNGETVQIASWTCNFSIYLDIQVYLFDIQAITTLLCLLLVLYVFVPSFYVFIFLPTSWKLTFSGIQNLLQPTVFNQQASDWVHCEEETGAYYQLSRHAYKFVLFFYKFLKFLILPLKNIRISKNSQKFIINFFSQRQLGIRKKTIFSLCTKCNDNFKFTISLKLNGAKDFIAVPPNACLFSITPFLYGWQKIFTNKNIFSKHDLHVLFISFFSKINNKKHLSNYRPLKKTYLTSCQ